MAEEAKPEGDKKEEQAEKAKSEDKPETKAEAKAETKAEDKSKGKSKGKSDAKAEGKSEDKSKGKSDAKAGGKSEDKSETKAEDKSKGKPDAKAEDKAETKAEAEVQAETKAETKAGTKAAPKAKAKAKAKKTYIWGTGRRKSAVARVRIRPGGGAFQVNGKELKEYFGIERLRAQASSPLTATSTLGKVDVFVNVHGGGPTGQAGATIMGVARALMKMDESLSAILRSKGFLTRDARKVERKKYGRRGARRSFQFSKR